MTQNNSKTVVILAAGQNSRFFPLNTDFHKSGFAIAGQPLIVGTLNNLQSHGFNQAIIVTSPKDQQPGGLKTLVEEFELQIKIKWVVQPKAEGMGDALLRAKDSITTDSFGLCFGSSISAGEILEQLYHHPIALAGSTTTQPHLYGILRMEGDKASGVIEKPAIGTEPSNIKLEGIYWLNQAYLDILSQTPITEYSFETALDTLLQQQSVAVEMIKTTSTSLKFPWHLHRYRQLVLPKLSSHIDPNATISSTAVLDDSGGPIIIKEGVHVGHAARIVGPTYIGPNSLIGDFSFVRHSNIEDQVTIGANTEVVRSILYSNSEIHFGYLADSIVNSGTKIGAGLITANKRLDRQTIITLVKNHKTDTALKALGTIIGKNANLGVRTTTMPGVLIGANQTVLPGQIVSKNIA